MKRAIAMVVVALGLCTGLTACKSSSEPGVTSNYHSQWTNVNADVQSTTRAAEGVLNEAQLKSVTSSSTNVDGKATGAKADGTKVSVAVRKQGSGTSQVSVTVGTLGDPTLGADLARRIKDRAEGTTGGSSTMTR